MKKLSFFVSAFALCASASYAAIDCGSLPSCESLGYNDAVADCPSSSEVLKCPFDTTKGKCTRGPAVGDLKYSLNTSNHNGWILCNGQGIDKTKYSALYSIIGTNYGSSGNNFYVPDYRGFFLRAAGTATVNNQLSSYGGSANSDLKTPQKEQLPEIQGYLWADKADKMRFTGMFSKYYHLRNGKKLSSQVAEYGGEAIGSTLPYGTYDTASVTVSTYSGEWGPDGSGNAYLIDVKASNSNSIYTNGGHVIPANYVANIFIYAGK